jgi:hypothetical protein
MSHLPKAFGVTSGQEVNFRSSVSSLSSEVWQDPGSQSWTVEEPQRQVRGHRPPRGQTLQPWPVEGQGAGQDLGWGLGDKEPGQWSTSEVGNPLTGC